jgi:hypothetical protein
MREDIVEIRYILVVVLGALVALWVKNLWLWCSPMGVENLWLQRLPAVPYFNFSTAVPAHAGFGFFSRPASQHFTFFRPHARPLRFLISVVLSNQHKK